MRMVGRYLPLFVLPLLLQIVSVPAFSAAHGKFDVKGTAEIANDLGTQLGLSNHIRIQIVPSNPLGFSVQPVLNRKGDFLISIDQNFMNLLSEEELRAAIAHELGHVWIFTHHPYLQTEVLANQVATRVVTRDLLEKVYTKLWAFKGMSGKLDDVLGPGPRPGSH